MGYFVVILIFSQHSKKYLFLGYNNGEVSNFSWDWMNNYLDEVRYFTSMIPQVGILLYDYLTHKKSNITVTFTLTREPVSDDVSFLDN